MKEYILSQSQGNEGIRMSGMSFTHYLWGGLNQIEQEYGYWSRHKTPVPLTNTGPNNKKSFTITVQNQRGTCLQVIWIIRNQLEIIQTALKT